MILNPTASRFSHTLRRLFRVLRPELEAEERKRQEEHERSRAKPRRRSNAWTTLS